MGILSGNRRTLLKGLGFSLLFAQISPALFAQSADPNELDWVPRSELTEAQLAECPAACKGAYVNPAANGSVDPSQAPIEGLADFSEIDTANETAILEGNVEFTQGFRQLRAERVKIDRGQASLSLDGDISIREPGILMTGDSASIDSGENRIEINNAQYVIHEQRIRGTADRIERSPFAGISIDNATYTSCEPGDDTWVLYAGELHIDEQTGRATARNVKLEVADTPVAYIPWFQFMVDERRASGLLYPEVGYSTDEGFKYAQPYYLNLAPNQDLTLTPRLAGKRGTGLKAEYRLLTTQSYSQFAGTFFPDDDINPQYPDNRWASSIKHRGIFGALRSQIDLQAVSDDDFLDDWTTESISKNDRDVFLEQNAQLSAQLGNWHLSAATRGYQNLIDDDYRHYRELPRLNALGKYQFGELEVELDSELTRFDLSSNQVSQYIQYLPDQNFHRPEGDRLRLDWSVAWDKQESWGYMRPSLGAAYRSYNLDAALLGSADESPAAFAAEASLDAGLVFERQTSLGETRFIQTLEPRLYYLYRDADAQNDLPVFDTRYATESFDQLFRDSIYVGGDRMEAANRLTLGVQSRFYSTDSQREVLTLGIGQSFYLDNLDSSLIPPYNNAPLATGDALFIDPNTDGAVSGFRSGAFIGSFPASGLQFLSGELYQHIHERNRNRSELMGEANWKVNTQWSASTNLYWDTEKSGLDQSLLQLNYQATDSNNSLKLGYLTEKNRAYVEFDSDRSSTYLVDRDIAQVFVRGQWSINEQWGLVLGLHEDLENDRNLDRLLGVSYESCCWNITLGWRDRLERSISDGMVVTDPARGKSVILSFEFFGLGGIGRSGAELVQSP